MIPNALKIFLSKMKLCFVFSAFLIIQNPLFSETKTDSLLSLLPLCKHDTDKVILYNQIALELAPLDAYQSEKYVKLSKTLASKINYQRGLAYAYRVLGLDKFYQVKYSESLEYNDTSLIIFNKIGDKKGQATVLNMLGVIYSAQDLYEKALDYYTQSMLIRKFFGDSIGLGKSLNNIGSIYKKNKNYSKALQYFEQAIENSTKFGDKKNTGMVLNNIGEIYLNLGKFNEALAALKKSLIIRKEINDLHGLSNTYYSLGQYFLVKKNINVAIQHFESAYKLARQIKIAYEIESTAKGLSDAYYASGNFKKAYEYYLIFNIQNDSSKQDNIQKKITEIEMNETFKKERELNILKQQKIDIETKRNNERQKLFRNFAFILVVLFGIIILLIYRNFRIKKKDNIILQAQKDEILQKNIDINQRNEEIETQRDQLQSMNNELWQRNEEITSQRDEIEEQRNSIIQQKELIEAQKEKTESIFHELKDSILYAMKIQKAVLPDDQSIHDCFVDSFILFRPVQIVSGDFYWIHRRNQYILFAVADCTGHGVPGGFMSMLGISLLNEIAARTDITQSSQVLDELRDKIIFSLNQQGIYGEQQDGMDIAFCALNTETLELQFAGANNPVWINRTLSSDTERSRSAEMTELVEIKGDKQPIGIYKYMKPFINQVIQLQKNDIIYLASDGYADQFGGPKRKKFLSKNLKEILLTHHQFPMLKQKNILDLKFDEWKGNHEQIDDVTIMGLKI